MRQQQSAKEADLSRKYSAYIDAEPAFLFGREKIVFPKMVNGCDRAFIKIK